MTTETITRLRSASKEDAGRVVRELERQASTKRDIVADSRSITLVPPSLDAPPQLAIDLGGVAGKVAFGIGDHAHKQIAEKLDIPPAYYRRMRAGAPELLAENVNHWLGENGKSYLVRTLDGKARALLSDRYRVLDSVDLFYEAAQIASAAGAEFHELELTDERFFMRLLHPEWRERIDYQLGHRGEVMGPGAGPPTIVREPGAGNGDWLVPGVLLTNSEIGEGGTSVEFFVKRLACMNGLVTDMRVAKVHLGRKLDLGFLTDETRQLEDRLVWSQIRDVIRGAFDRDVFRAYVARINEAAAETLAEPVAAVDAVVKNYDLSDDVRQRILNELASPSRGSDPGRTVWGLVNAVTAAAREATDAEAEVALQRVGGQILEHAEEFVVVRR